MLNLLLFQDNSCVERSHPGGDQCCVLWVCLDQAEQDTGDTGDNADTVDNTLCENIFCGDHATCDPTNGDCLCNDGYSREDTSGSCTLVTTQSNINLLQITSSSIQVQFPDITGGNLMYIETRLFGRKDPPWENAILVEGNEIFTLTGLKPDTSYTLRWKSPDKQYPDIQVSVSHVSINQEK